MAEKGISQWILAEYCTRETKHDCTPNSCGLGPNATVKAFFYRSRLARMTGLEEPESEHSSHWGKRRILVRDTALALGQAIEETMQVLFASDSEQSITLSGSWGRTFRLFWAIKCSRTSADSSLVEDGTTQMSLRRAINNDRPSEGSWKAEASEIEAFLGLWYWSLKEQEPRNSQDVEDVSSKKVDQRIDRILWTSQTIENTLGEIKVQDSSTQPGSRNVSKSEGNEHYVNQSSSPRRNRLWQGYDDEEQNEDEEEEKKEKDEFVVGIGENKPPSESDGQRRFFWLV